MGSEAEPRKRGRPAKFGGERTRGSLTIRLRDEVRSELERAAVKHGRSLSEEIESRMEVSLAHTEQLKYEWGEDIFRIASALAVGLSRLEDWSGHNWLEDNKTSQIFKLLAGEVISNYEKLVKRRAKKTSVGDFDGKSEAELAQMFAALSGLKPPRPKSRSVNMIVSDGE